MGVDSNEFSLLDHFLITVINLQTLQFLFQELKQILENKKECLIIYTSEAREGKKEAYVQVSVGHSETSLIRFGKSFEDMIGWKANGDAEKKHKSRVKVAKAVGSVN